MYFNVYNYVYAYHCFKLFYQIMVFLSRDSIKKFQNSVAKKSWVTVWLFVLHKQMTTAGICFIFNSAAI